MTNKKIQKFIKVWQIKRTEGIIIKWIACMLFFLKKEKSRIVRLTIDDRHE